MPRPKPRFPLIVRSVKMTEANWALFDRLGGAAWLRGKMRIAASVEGAIADKLKQGATRKAIASDLRVSTKTIQTVWRNMNENQRKSV